jgi:hypothetical protein
MIITIILVAEAVTCVLDLYHRNVENSKFIKSQVTGLQEKEGEVRRASQKSHWIGERGGRSKDIVRTKSCGLGVPGG